MQYEKLIMSICYQFVKDMQIAEDLTQETFLSAYKHIQECKKDQYKPWLARIAANKAKDYLKSAYNKKVTQYDTQEKSNLFLFENVQSITPEDTVIANDEVVYIKNYIENMGEPYINVARMHFLQHKSVKEIAQELKRPPKTVHSQLFRAKHIIMRELKERGGQT